MWILVLEVANKKHGWWGWPIKYYLLPAENKSYVLIGIVI